LRLDDVELERLLAQGETFRVERKSALTGGAARAVREAVCALRDTEVAVVTVTPSDSPPVRYDGRIHVRIGPRKGIATTQDERILAEKRRRIDIPS